MPKESKPRHGCQRGGSPGKTNQTEEDVEFRSKHLFFLKYAKLEGLLSKKLREQSAEEELDRCHAVVAFSAAGFILAFVIIFLYLLVSFYPYSYDD